MVPAGSCRGDRVYGGEVVVIAVRPYDCDSTTCIYANKGWYTTTTVTGDEDLLMSSTAIPYRYYTGDIAPSNRRWFDPVFYHVRFQKWWDWFRTGAFMQESRKKWAVKQTIKPILAYWRKMLPAKSGWVGPAMARRKGV